MGFFKGIQYAVRGLAMGLTTPLLLLLGMARFVVLLVITIALTGLVFYYQDAILAFVWEAPDQGFMLFLWELVSWLLSILLALVSVIVSYFFSQVIFGLFVMDYMSRVTERIRTGREDSPDDQGMIRLFFYLIRQEIPRALIPVALSLLIMAAGFLTPFGPLIAVLSSLTAAAFLAWDNTDLVYARRMFSFQQRIGFFKKNLLFHIGFGLFFLIPWVNILFFSFAPVGATLYCIENEG
ncbi:MAG: EI24 domain-containing protein [Desulfarculaceae bacterium]|nr:EI24 domain-containing protein [Desulfarculaceae bacterium]